MIETRPPLKIEPYFLPPFCYSEKKRLPLGRAVHYFSCIVADPDQWDNPTRCRELFIDMNRPAKNRTFGPWKGLTDKRGYASADYLVLRDGGIWQLVPPDHKSWHAGYSRWKGRDHCNAWMGGIEVIAAPQVSAAYGFLDAQYWAIAHLCAGVERRWIAGHKAIRDEWNRVYPDRTDRGKKDPGPSFDWKKLWYCMDVLENEQSDPRHGLP